MDALELALITLFVCIMCCVIFIGVQQILLSYNIETDIVKCVDFVIKYPGSSINMAVYSSGNIAVTPSFNKLRVGPTVVAFPDYVHIVTYVRYTETRNLYIAQGFHVIHCYSYYNFTSGTGKPQLYVIITLYK